MTNQLLLLVLEKKGDGGGDAGAVLRCPFYVRGVQTGDDSRTIPSTVKQTICHFGFCSLEWRILGDPFHRNSDKNCRNKSWNSRGAHDCWVNMDDWLRYVQKRTGSLGTRVA